MLPGNIRRVILSQCNHHTIPMDNSYNKCEEQKINNIISTFDKLVQPVKLKVKMKLWKASALHCVSLEVRELPQDEENLKKFC